jgi:hypothetical protein
MQKLKVKKGCLFSCAWLPPTEVIVLAFREVFPAEFAYKLLGVVEPSKLLVTFSELPATLPELTAPTIWLCCGS